MLHRSSTSKKRGIALGASVLLVFCAAVAAAAWYYGQPPQSATPAKPKEPQAISIDPESARILDRDFVERLLVHDQQAIELLDIEIARGQSPALRKWATETKAARQLQLAEVVTLLQQWGEPYKNLSEYPQQSGHDLYPSLQGMATPEQLTALRSAPPASVDAKFLELMTEHLYGSISMIQAHKSKAVDQDVRRLIESVLERRAEEQAHLRNSES